MAKEHESSKNHKKKNLIKNVMKSHFSPTKWAKPNAVRNVEPQMMTQETKAGQAGRCALGKNLAV